MLEIGKAIRVIRQAKNLKQNDLAKGASVSAPFLSLIENGERQPSLAVIRKIAAALAVPSEALILLAQPRQGTLRTEDRFTVDLARLITALVEAEDGLRRKMTGAGDSSATSESDAR